MINLWIFKYFKFYHVDQYHQGLVAKLYVVISIFSNTEVLFYKYTEILFLYRRAVCIVMVL